MIAPSDAPGIGIEWDAQAVARCRLQERRDEAPV
jgi:L-alanine-DL-glutamate epimerase-like enolase superfamily enzyme